MPVKYKVAVLGDYQNAALESADWSVLRDRTDIAVFHDHLAEPDAVIEPALRRVLMMRLLFTEPFPQSKSPQKPANACELVADGGDDSCDRHAA